MRIIIHRNNKIKIHGGKWWAHSYPNDNLNSDGCDIYIQ